MRDRNHANGLGERLPASTGVLDPRILSPPLGGGATSACGLGIPAEDRSSAWRTPAKAAPVLL